MDDILKLLQQWSPTIVPLVGSGIVIWYGKQRFGALSAQIETQNQNLKFSEQRIRELTRDLDHYSPEKVRERIRALNEQIEQARQIETQEREAREELQEQLGEFAEVVGATSWSLFLLNQRLNHAVCMLYFLSSDPDGIEIKGDSYDEILDSTASEFYRLFDGWGKFNLDEDHLQIIEHRRDRWRPMSNENLKAVLDLTDPLDSSEKP